MQSMKNAPMCGQIWIVMAALLGAPAAAAESSPPPDYRPPDTREICPALAEDYEICSGNPWSGNCADFVIAAGRLGEIYRSELIEHPGWVVDLQNTIWWGCGSAALGELRSALERIDTPAARAVLADEPYRSLGLPSAPPPPTVPHPETDCAAPGTEVERNACAANRLAIAKVGHEREFTACRGKVASTLRPELIDAETRWENLLLLECTGAPYERDECLARAYEERTQSIAMLHPECAAPRADPS